MKSRLKGLLNAGSHIVLILGLVLVFGTRARAEEKASIKISDALSNLQIGVTAFVDYSAGTNSLPNEKWTRYNRFALTRGYLTLMKEFTPWFSVRVTSDLNQSSTGSYDIRFKYLYGQFKIPKLLILTDIKTEIGMGHTPWMDFEETMNTYRAQGTMSIDRAGIFSSSDVGVGVLGYFGGKLADAKAKTGNGSYDGKYGSWQIGVYNGGGYAAVENNQNKVLEGRITLRPLPGIAPWIQLSYFGLTGQGNAKFTTKIMSGKTVIPNTPYNRYPLFDAQVGMLSFQHPWVTFTSQYWTAKGNAAGTLIDARGYPLEAQGYSFFGNVKLPVLGGKPAIFARYDFFDPDTTHRMSHKVWDAQSLKWYKDHGGYDQYIAGVSYDFYKGNMIIFDYQYTVYGRDSAGRGKVPVLLNDLASEHMYQVVMQVKF